ncbi:hypothetical protein [Bradyrhizobium sp. B117]|uniref:hypothetical protein n=1 Tax=Bradyrhizobium sp. B117 TaxID=3140246 RepID=UPI003182C12A
MTDPSNPHAQTAVQLLVWALEEIEKAANMEAAQHARSALDAIRKSMQPDKLATRSITEPDAKPK